MVHTDPSCLYGSSPLTRGAPWTDESVGEKRGLIPAHAGSTILSKACIISPPAHPRSRGEHAGAGGWG